MAHLGDFVPGAIVYCKFNSHDSTGAPITLAGSPVVSVYKDNSTTEASTGVTTTVDFDSITGLHHVTITTASDGSFYTTGSTYSIVLTNGTVSSISVVGTQVHTFTIGMQTVPMKRPVGAIPALGITDNGTAQLATSTTMVLRAAASLQDDTAIGNTIFIVSASAGSGQTAVIEDYVSSNDTASFTAWSGGITPTGSIEYIVFCTAPSPVTNISSAVLDEFVEGTTTVRQSLMLSNASAAGKLDGAGTTTVHLRDLADTKNRVTATIDGSNNRTAITTDVT